MGRHGRDETVIELVGLLALLLVLGWTFSPAFRQLVAGVAILALFIVLVLVAALVLYRYTKNYYQRRAQSSLGPPSENLPHPLAQTSHPADFLKKETGWSGVSIDTSPPTVPNPTTTEELIRQLRSIDWFQFEKIMAATFEHLGYTVHRRGGANPDGGIDLIVEHEGEKTAVQCKHWKTRKVRVRAVRKFLGALTDAGLKKGTLVTLCGYTGDAKRLADKHGIEIVNETDVARLLETTNAASNPQVLALLNDGHKFCPKCEREMVVKTAEKGPNPGSQFWGCTGYPRCRYTMPT